MSKRPGKARSLVLPAVLALGLGAAAGQAAAASYVDDALKDPAPRAAVAHPQPVQLLFQFKTNGALNARATKMLKKQVTTLVQESGLFSQVSDDPAPNGAVVSITIENTAAPGAAQKGFVTGLTFGLKGSTVEDDYLCTVDYLGGGNAAKITKTLHHAIYTTVGIAQAPPHSVKAANVGEAVTTMTRQVVLNDLNSLATDPAFSGAPAAASPAPVPPTAAGPAPNATPAPAPAAAPADPAATPQP